MTLKKCVICGKEFEQKSKVYHTKTCSATCAKAHAASLKRKKQIRCIVCGKEFEPLHYGFHQRKICSVECKKIQATRAESKRIITCIVCGRKIERGSRAYNVQTCSDSCRRKQARKMRDLRKE